MPTIQQQLNQLKKDKASLNTMLNTMGVETTGNETFTQLAPLVGKIVTDPILQDKTVEITTNGTTNVTADEGYDGLNSVEVTTNVAGSGGGKYAPRHISFYAYDGTDLKDELANLDTSNVTSMYGMFRQCLKLTNLDLRGFDTSNVTTMYGMFYTSRSLTNLDVSSFDTRNVKNMEWMFYTCDLLTELDLSNFNTSNVTSMKSMFSLCRGLTKLDIRNFVFTKVTEYTDVFKEVPSDCLIIVKDETAKEWVLARRKALTNVKTVAELG